MANIEKIIEDITKELTLEEKVNMVHAVHGFYNGGAERLGIPNVKMSDGPNGVREEVNEFGNKNVAHGDDFTTCLPSASTLASTWNKDMARVEGKILGLEARGRKKDVILGPGVNIKRDPRCGRNFEYLSEDPYLSGEMAIEYILGVQENDVAACLKHFAVNSQETNRWWVDEQVTERALREIYLPAFEKAVKKAKPYSLMNAYNKVNGHHCSENVHLLDEILRGEWGYDGCVISDWGSVHTTAESFNTTLDIEMDCRGHFDEFFWAKPLLEALKAGELDESWLDEKIKNILRMMFRIKMLGDDVLNRKTGEFNNSSTREAALEIAREGVVLLKNEGDILPLDESKTAMTLKNPKKALVASAAKKKIAVIGVNAVQPQAVGGGSSGIKSLYEISPLMGFQICYGGNVDIEYAPGYFVPGKRDYDTDDMWNPSLERRVFERGEHQDQKDEILAKRAELKAQALEVAKSADFCIFVGGINREYDMESIDRVDCKLPYAQDELIAELLKVNPDTIICMVGGSYVEMPWLADAKAVVWSYYGGIEAGRALAEVVSGKVNPSGHLAETFPVSLEDTVTFKNKSWGMPESAPHTEGIYVGYRYYEAEDIKPAFAFGHGLSYTSFDIKIDSVKTGVLADECPAIVCVKVKNTGKTAGKCVAQVYVSDIEATVDRPEKELAAFAKVELAPGEEKTVEIPVERRAFEFWSDQYYCFISEPGEFNIMVGEASDKIADEKVVNF